MEYTLRILVWYCSFIVTLNVFCEANPQYVQCGQEELAACARPLEVLSDTSQLTFVTGKTELDKLCPDLNTGLHCIRSYTRRCMNIQQREHFNKLYQATGEVIQDLCEQGPYQEDFLRHAPCLRHVKSSYERCSKRYQEKLAIIAGRSEAVNISESEKQINDEENVKNLCCAFREYIVCAEFTVHRTCGKDAAFFTRSFLDRIAKQLLSMHCENYSTEPGQCGVPVDSGMIRLNPSVYTTTTIFLLIITIYFLLH